MSELDPRKRNVDFEKLRVLGRELLVALGEDPDRPGLKDTPRRWAEWWREFVHYYPGKVDVTFESVTLDQLVTVSGIRVWSLCEHHLLPFYCDVSVGYLTNSHVLGLSKFGRIAHAVAHKLQIQERVADEIADLVCQTTKSANVAVVTRGQHLCMTMRGIRTPSEMTASVMRGVFREDHKLRQEFMAVVGNGRTGHGAWG